GNNNAAEIRDKAARRKGAGPQIDVARQRAMAALAANRPAEARTALASMRALDPEHPAVALLERRIQDAAPAEVGESTNPGLNPEAPKPPPPPSFHDPSPSSYGASSSMDGGIGDLSLDALTLDEPPGMVVQPPPGMRDSVTGPLHLGVEALAGDASESFSLDMNSNETFNHGGSTGAP